MTLINFYTTIFNSFNNIIIQKPPRERGIDMSVIKRIDYHRHAKPWGGDRATEKSLRNIKGLKNLKDLNPTFLFTSSKKRAKQTIDRMARDFGWNLEVLRKLEDIHPNKLIERIFTEKIRLLLKPDTNIPWFFTEIGLDNDIEVLAKHATNTLKGMFEIMPLGTTGVAVGHYIPISLIEWKLFGHTNNYEWRYLDFLEHITFLQYKNGKIFAY